MHPQYHDDTLTQKRDPQVYKYRNTKENDKVQNTQDMKIEALNGLYSSSVGNEYGDDDNDGYSHGPGYLE